MCWDRHFGRITSKRIKNILLDRKKEWLLIKKLRSKVINVISKIQLASRYIIDECIQAHNYSFLERQENILWTHTLATCVFSSLRFLRLNFFSCLSLCWKLFLGRQIFFFIFIRFSLWQVANYADMQHFFSFNRMLIFVDVYPRCKTIFDVMSQHRPKLRHLFPRICMYIHNQAPISQNCLI